MENTLIIPRRHYLQPGFPVLALHYAIYCDGEWSRAVTATWRAKRAQAIDYRDYFDSYDGDVRAFPSRAQHLFAVEVAKNPLEGVPPGIYRPNREQATEMAGFLFDEMTDTPTSEQPHPRTPPSLKRETASPNADRPLLSCLAGIFLNRDPIARSSPDEFLRRFALGAEIRALLHAFLGDDSREYLDRAEADRLTPSLVDELTKMPAAW